MKSFYLSKIAILIAALTLLQLCLFSGCTHQDKIVSDESDSTGPEISVALNRPADTTAIEAVVTITGTTEKIIEVVYSISGNTSTSDTILYAQGMTEICETVPIPDDIGLNPDSSLTIEIVAYDDHGSSSTYSHRFYPIDNEPPLIAIDYNIHGYAPRDTVLVHVTASDNKGLYSITLSAAGAFAWNTTLEFAEPYPTEIDTTIGIPIPLTTYLNFEFWITAEAVDANFNAAMASPASQLTIVLPQGPITEVHQVGGGSWVQRGDSLRFWVVGYDNAPLVCLGYQLRYGRNEIWYTIEFRDSLPGDYNNIDSAYFAYYVPDTIYCDNDLYVSPFAYDHQGHYAYMNDCFMVEGRIRFSQAAEFTTPGTANSYIQLLVDDRRNLVYLGTSYKPWINVYSQTTRQFLDPIDLPQRANGVCLSADTNSILVIHPVDYKLSVVNIEAPVPHIDTTIELPGLPWDIAALSDGTALIKLVHIEDPPQLLRLSLIDYAMDTLDLGSVIPMGVTASGNSEYVLIRTFNNNSGESELFIYQSGVGIILSRTVNWMASYGVANYDGSRFAVGGWDLDKKVGIFTADLSLIGSISAGPCHASIRPTAFSRDADDLYVSFGWFIGLFKMNTWSIEGFYHLNSYLDSQQHMVYFATNDSDDRLFITSQNGGAADYFFYDIPIDPE